MIKWARDHGRRLPIGEDGRVGVVKLDEIWQNFASNDTTQSQVSFTPAVDVKGAENYARTTFGVNSVSYKGISLDVANEMNAAILRGITRVPQIQSQINAIGGAQTINESYRRDLATAIAQYARQVYPGLSDAEYQRIGDKKAQSMGRVKRGTLAFARRSSSANSIIDSVAKQYDGVFINELEGKDAAQLRETLAYEKSTGYSATGTIAGLFDHEIGHEIDHALGIRKNTEMLKLWNGLTRDEIDNGLSKYATNSIAEFIAEGYAEYVGNENPRPIAIKIGEIIDKEIKNDKR